MEYKVVTFIIIEGQRLEVMGSTYSVEREVSDTIHITTPSVGVECRDQDGNRYDVYRTLPKIKITSDLESSRFQFAVIHGLDRIVYQDFDMLSRDAACERVDSSVVLDLEASTMAKSDGIYTLRSHNRDIHRFVVLQNFYYQFAEVEYKENGKSTMRCSYIDEDVEFDTDRGDVALPAIKMDGRDLTITIQIPSRRFSFDKIHWKMFDSDEIYFQNFAHKNIYIYCPTLIIPVITANIKDSKPLNLDIDGRYLVADIGRIKQISCLLQYSSVYMPKIRFCCDKYDLFTIRYYASYERDGNIITRVDAPESTYGRLIVPDRDPIIFQDWVEIPDVYDCIIQIEECYDDGFSGELSIKVKKIDRGFYLACDPNLIIHGSSINNFKYVCDGDEHYYRGNPFYHIYGIDGPAPDKNALEIERKAFNKMDEMAYPRLEDKVKEYILNDRDGKRTAARMMRLKDIDREFAIRLGENYQKKNTSVWVTEELSSLKC